MAPDVQALQAAARTAPIASFDRRDIKAPLRDAQARAAHRKERGITGRGPRRHGPRITLAQALETLMAAPKKAQKRQARPRAARKTGIAQAPQEWFGAEMPKTTYMGRKWWR